MEAALEQYLILAKNAKGKACEALIGQAISNQKTFVFGELLDAVQDGKISEEHYKILEIFTYGTLADYRKARLPDLSPQQLRKLQMLTLTSLASERSVLGYNELMTVLEIGSIRQLEDLIIDSIYEGLIKGKLDHKNSCLRAFECIGRDLRPERVPEIMNKIGEYVRHMESLEETAIKNIEKLQKQKTQAEVKKEEFQKIFNSTKESVKASVNLGNESHDLFSKIKKQLNIGAN